MNLLIINNPNIRGIICGDWEIKLTQFADDTTLFLDGTLLSLEAALNTLEIFGSISGLKVNTDKTQIVWIGKKKHCKEKLGSLKFQWDVLNFNMLGLILSVDLEKCNDLNFAPKLLDIQANITKWSKHILTPIGKIVVVRTLLPSKLIHCFISLLNLCEDFVK